VDPENIDAIVAAVDKTLAGPLAPASGPELWDGHAGDRIVQVVADWAAGVVF
jgi:hypothetical protein